MISPKYFLNTLKSSVQIYRLSSRKSIKIVNNHQRLHKNIRRELSEDAKMKYIRERINLEVSELLYAKGTSYINLEKTECPNTYDLFVKGKLIEKF